MDIYGDIEVIAMFRYLFSCPTYFYCILLRYMVTADLLFKYADLALKFSSKSGGSYIQV